MTYLPGRSTAVPLMCAALIMRMFCGMAIDFPFAMNAAWMCPLIGFIIFLPFAFALTRIGEMGSGSVMDQFSACIPKPMMQLLQAGFALLLLYDASVNVRLLASSSNIIALNDSTVHMLILPLSLVIGIVVWLGVDAAGKSARIWLKLLPLLVLIVLLVQLRGYRIGWLAPVLGGGVGSILNGSIYCAGCMTLSALIWMIASADRGGHGVILPTALSSLAVAALMLTQHLSFPSMINIPFTRAARIELILSNGRMSLSPQIILDVLWFGNLLNLLSAEASTAAAYLHRSIPGLPIYLLAILEGAAVSILAVFNPEWLQESSGVIRSLFMIVGGLLVCMMIALLIGKRGEASEQA